MIPVPTVRLFEADAYLAEAEGRIVSVSEHGIRLDRTLLYANSGGQSGDTGTLLLNDGQPIEIADASSIRPTHCRTHPQWVSRSR